MKLLTKTSHTYLWFSTVILLLAGTILFFLITSLINEETQEEMQVNIQYIENQLGRGYPIRNIPPIITVEKVSRSLPNSLTTGDTLLFDPVEGENELFSEMISVSNINGDTYRITYRQVALEKHDYIGSIGLSLLIVFLLLLVGLFFLNRKVAGKVWKPFYDNLKILENYSLEENSKIDLVDSNIKEFQELNRSIYLLTDKIRNDYLMQKEFVANSAHEMQTPLSIIQADLEQALQDQNLSESQAENIKSSLLAVMRLSKLNKSLLFLMKIENRQYERTHRQEVKKQVSYALESFNDFITAKNLHVKFNNDDVPLVINANETLVNSLLYNLIGNAIKHNLHEGSIEVVFQKHALIIRNTGEKPVKPVNTYFDRFVKADSSSSSAGLGLSIVKKICDHYGWHISYSYEDNFHTIRIEF